MIVIDASALLEVLLRTGAAAAAEEVLFGGSALHAPHVLDLEVAQVLRRYVLRGELRPRRAAQAYAFSVTPHGKRGACGATPYTSMSNKTSMDFCDMSRPSPSAEALDDLTTALRIERYPHHLFLTRGLVAARECHRVRRVLPRPGRNPECAAADIGPQAVDGARTRCVGPVGRRRIVEPLAAAGRPPSCSDPRAVA